MARREDWCWNATAPAAGIQIRSGGYSNIVEIDRVGIMYDRYPPLSFRTFYLGDCT